MATYDKMTSLKNEGRPVQVESAIRDGSGKNIENNYAKQNGYYAQLTSGKSQLADNLTPYSEDSGAEQEQPFISQGTGCGNGTEIVTTGDYALLREKQGNTVVGNNQLQNGNFANLDGWSMANVSGKMSISASGNVLYVSMTDALTEQWASIVKDVVSNVITGHTYLLFVNKKSSKTRSNSSIGITNSTVLKSNSYSTTNTKQLCWSLLTINENANHKLNLYPFGTDEIQTTDTAEFSEAVIVNLTQMFNGDIPQDLLDHPENFFRYYNGSLAYNTGSLESSNGRYLVATGRNIWDEEWEIGNIDNSSGQNSSTEGFIRSKNYCKCIPNTTYYLYVVSEAVRVFFYDENKNYISNVSMPQQSGIAAKTFITPSNAVYFRLKEYTATYNNDITISLYYTPEQGGEGYDQYYPYEEPTIVDTGSETLLFLDNKLPSGVINRNSGELSITSSTTINRGETSGVYYFYIGISDCVSPNLNDEIKPICNRYVSVKSQYITSSPDKSMMYLIGGHAVIIRDDSITSVEAFHTAYDNVMKIQYELADASKTTEQGTTFPENIKINDYGMMYWLDSSNNLVSIPQGNKLFYPVNYKGFVDDVYSRTEGDASKLVIQNELSAVDTKHDGLYAIMQENVGGALRHQLADKASIDFANTGYKDLGNDLYFFAEGTSGVYYATGFTFKSASGWTAVANVLCSLYITTFANNLANQVLDNAIAITPSGQLWIRDTSVANATALTSKLKGIILAYEKAST